MRYPIVPEDDSEFSLGHIKNDMNGFLDNPRIYLEYTPNNNYFLFQLGMILAYNHYTEAARLPTKDYRLTCPIEPTPNKSYGNVILDFMKNGTQQLPKYDRQSNKAFIVSSVREANEEDIAAGRLEKQKLALEGINGHLPYDDTPQIDKIGKDIVKTNMEKEAESGIVALLFKKGSKGSVVDLGSFYMFKHFLDSKMNYYYTPNGRQLRLLNDLGEGQFENLIRELAANKY